MSTVIYQYPKCSTCRKALDWLQERGIEYESIDIVKNPPSEHTLERAHHRSGLPLRKLFNTAGVSYREGDFKTRLPHMSEGEAISELARDGKLIKRPLLITNDRALVGFSPKAWEAAFS